MSISKVTSNNSQPTKLSDSYLVRAKHFNPLIDYVEDLSTEVDVLTVAGATALANVVSQAVTLSNYVYGATAITADFRGATMAYTHRIHTVSSAASTDIIILPVTASAVNGYEYTIINNSGATGFLIGTDAINTVAINGVTAAYGIVSGSDEHALILATNVHSTLWVVYAVSPTGSYVDLVVAGP